MRGQLPFAVEPDVVDARAIETVEVADAPAAGAVADLGVLAAAQVVLEDNAVGRGPPQRVGLAGDERENVPEAIVATDYQIRCACGHSGLLAYYNGSTV